MSFPPPGPHQPGPNQPGPNQPGPIQNTPGPHGPGPQNAQQLPVAHPGGFGAGGVRRKKLPVIAPIIAMVVGAIGFVLLSLMVLLADSPAGTKLVAVIATACVAVVGLAWYRWLDRWEPEPPFLLVVAFIWGAFVATAFAMLVNDTNALLFGDTFAAVVSAPFGEELLKGLFMVVVLLSTRRGRRELNSLTDTLIYAGIVGLGFTFLEDITYIIRVGQTPEDLVMILFIRIGLGAFGHSLYQSVFAVGLWAGVRRGTPGSIIGFGLLGYLGAVALHMMHNGVINGLATLLIVSLIELTVFVIGMVIAIRSSIGEGKNLRNQLPAMVHFGWVTEREAGWLASMRARKTIVAQASGDTQKVLKDYIQNATELAHLRTRLDQMKTPPSQGLLQSHEDLTALLLEQRSVVDSVLGQMQSAVPGGWPPVHGHQAPQYPAPLPGGPH